jgi:hypothetical protein
MAEDSKQPPKDESEHSIPELPLDVGVAEGVRDKIIETGKEGKTSNENGKMKTNCPQPFIVKMDKGKGLSKQEAISLVSVILSFIAIVIATCSVNQAIKSVAISDSTFKMNRIKDSLAVISQTKRNSIDSVQRIRNDFKDSVMLALAQNSLNTQIKSVGESQKQFKSLNRPILQIGDIGFTSFGSDIKPVLACKIENAGSFAAKVMTRKLKVVYVQNLFEKPSGKWMIINIPTYITKETPLIENFFMNDVVGTEYYKAISDGVLKVIAIGEIDYVNEVTKENWLFEFVIEIKPMSSEFIIRVANNRLK